MTELRLGFLASHSGTNMQAIIDSVKNGYFKAHLCAAISNNSQSGALERARKEGIPAFHVSEKTHPGKVGQQVIEIFDKYQVNTVVLAGYMKKLEPFVIDHFNGRVLNIHPALLPKFGGEGMYGINVHKAVIEAGEKVSGATVHLVNADYDRGRILMQMEVEVLPDDTPESLAEKVLKIEHKLYPEVLKKISLGEIIIP
ncbi:MAG TPA: phosphoribosylglycinamide formyltransferase [Candidatus Kapabacteria bacterium]|nr:phosphoribosylglycinamide formyltransferase [Candidatus Kapabacteria bacterium]HOM05505.1 phosphoribosylglycinamide formyltransferase [Candidatus Kapabacteria bacterium]HOQ49179.1 phosphoribosylglycinamide formyltransferase [Candidatus Kapabacteria bacterium]HPP40320.1 phosphoribosylglycinamide formyltransferase [Candidatus Kapabacteria bacterium]HPU24349.1 phosphoribosylglycinamide formyltransferase [Candidatus Kapabacteria bacterium]